MKKYSVILLFFSIFKAEAQASASVIADSLYSMANYTKAINYYAKVGSLKSSLQIARAYNAIGNHQKAILQYENLVDKAADYQIARFELGKLYVKTKRYDDGRKLFETLANNDANNPAYLYFLGEAFRGLKQVDSSIVSYKKAVTVDSTHLKSLFQLGKYYVIQRETNEALRYLDLGLQFYADDVSLINLKALALFNNAAFDKALPLFERLVALGEKKKFVYTKLAHCYFKTWEFEKAKSTYHQLIEMDEDNHEAYFNLGQVFAKDRQIDSAKYYIKKSIEVQKVTFEKEYSSLAHLYRSEDDLATALKYYKLAANEDPTDPILYYQICALIDETTDDAAKKLMYYERYNKKYGAEHRYIFTVVNRRISELKEEIHFSKD